MIEFSTRGFAASRMEDVAKRAGVSKGAIYLHFSSKDALLDALVVNAFQPEAGNRTSLERGVLTADTVIDLLVDEAYPRLTCENVVALLHLVIAEGKRIPGLGMTWRESIVKSYADLLGKAMERGVREGTFVAHAASIQPTLLLAPIMQTVLLQLVLGHMSKQEHLLRRKAYRQMLSELLVATPRAEPAG